MSKTQNAILARIAARKARNEKFRPNKYKQEYCAEIVELMSQGLFPTQVAAKWSISMNTFYEWVRMKPDFSEAFGVAKAKCESLLLAHAQECLANKDDKGHNYWWKLGVLHFGWAAKAAETSTVSNTQININQMNVTSNKSDAELLELIKDKMEANQFLQLPDSITIDHEDDDSTE